jgi:peroxiredoxin
MFPITRETTTMRKTSLACMSAIIGVVAIGLVAAGSTAVLADEAKSEAKKKGVELGDDAPAWKKLAGVDDKKHSLAELKKAKAVIVVFTCNHCPVAKAYEERLVELHDKFAEKGVALVAINVNNVEADKLPAMKERAEEQGFEFAYLYDPSQEIGRQYGATVTPHAFVLDGKRKVVYRGAIDDSQDPAEVTKHYVSDAVDDVLAGKAPRVAESKQFGCGIQYE